MELTGLETTIIGIDCATQPNKVGLARGTFSAGGVVVHEVRKGSMALTPAAIADSWITAAPGPVLLALDAPLGWPVQLNEALRSHYAGNPIDEPASHLFHRFTDAFIRCHIGLIPLEVGANLIARTAHAALGLLQELRRTTGHRIPLAWSPQHGSDVEAIEVYPAATRMAHGLTDKPSDWESLGALVEHIPIVLEHESWPPFWVDGRDAVLCVLAAHDFLCGQAFSPTDLKLAEREGWIWVKTPAKSRCKDAAEERLQARAVVAAAAAERCGSGASG